MFNILCRCNGSKLLKDTAEIITVRITGKICDVCNGMTAIIAQHNGCRFLIDSVELNCYNIFNNVVRIFPDLPE